MRGLMNGRVLAPVHALVYGIMYALVLLGVHACMHALMNARALTGGLVCASVVLVWHAGVEAGPERQAAVRVFGEVFGEQEGRGAGGHQVPPVSNALLRLEPLLLHHKQNIQSLCNVGVFEFFPPRAYHVQIDHLDHLHRYLSLRGVRRICTSINSTYQTQDPCARSCRLHNSRPGT